jgi:hypothetical protein
MSDDEKSNIQIVDGNEILQKISTLESNSWRYTCQNDTARHYSICDCKFYEIFGEDGVGTISQDKNTYLQDYCGVLLIAIKKLTEKNNALEARVASLESKIV